VSAKPLTPEQARRQITRGVERVQQLTKDKPERQQRLALQEFYNQPVIQRLQETAFGGETRRSAQGVRNVARNALGILSPVLGQAVAALPDTTLGAFGSAAMEGGTFGVADRILGGIRSLTGGGSNAANVETQRAQTRFVRQQAPVAAVVGDIAGGAATGGLGVAGLRLGGQTAARVGGQVGQTVNRAIQGATTLQQGQRGANIARASLGGATAAALDAAGRGQDVSDAAVVGAAAGPIVLGGIRLGTFIGQKAADVFGMSGGPQVLRRIVSEPMEAIQARVDQARANGVEPTIFEVLSPTDRRRLADAAVARTDETRQAAQTAVQERGASIAPAMREVTETAAAPGRQRVVRQIEQDITASEGGVRPADAGSVAEQTARTPLDVLPLAQREYSSFLKPVENVPVAQQVSDFYPKGFRQLPNGRVEETQPFPELNSMINLAFGRLALKAADTAPLTVKQTDDAMKRLRGIINNPSSSEIDRELARQAAEHVESVMSAADPRIRQAAENARNAFNNRMNMEEGMVEGGRTRLRSEIQPGGARAQQDAANAFGTPGGTAGRALGQENRLVSEFGGTPDQALRRVEDIATAENTQRAIAQNLGETPAQAITRSAQQQMQGMQNIAEAARVNVEAPEDALPLVGRAVLALSPSALPSTRIWGMTWLANAVGMPERAAQQIVDRVFSQNPQVVEQTLRFLRDRTDYGDAFMRDFLAAVAGGQMGAEVADFANTPQGTLVEEPVVEEPMAAEAEVAEEPMVEGELIEAPEFNTAADVVSFLFPNARITDSMRDPNSKVGRANPNSAHITGVNAVDVAPVPGMTFEEYVMSFEDAGFRVKYARDEVNDPSSHATGPHWHIELE
jgi:hypothetical protein